ncbi:MAG TPA: cytochrome ubiquinol oxidase subunit I [Gemmatimonadota bacterium]|nr:cytochrome ubiquinol oxidase subunit I [Gemmatimonadota bacterium]
MRETSPGRHARYLRLGVACGIAAALGLWFAPDALLAQQVAPADAGEGVRTFFGISPRRVIWVVAQLHLLFAAFVVGVPWFTVVVEIIGWRNSDPKYDRLAREFTRLFAAAFATTAALGGLLTFTLIGLYPRFSEFFFGIFAPVMYVYGGIFLVETAALYLYYSSWDRLKQRKPLHIGLGLVLVAVGTVIVFIGSSMSSYMMSPTGVDETGRFVGTTWEALANPLWIPVVIHRLLGNITFGGFVVAAYAAVMFLTARTEPARAHYDWMGYVGNFVGLMALIPLPFAGYYLGREVYSVSPVMGNNMMGGDFSWAFIIQAMLVGLLFIIGNYYLWAGMRRIPGAERYQKYIKYYIVVLVVCVAVWLTPRNLPLSPTEQLALGSQVHPLLGALGLMSTKNAVINLIILTTFLSFLLYRRANKIEAVPLSGRGLAPKVWVVAAGALCLAILGWYAGVLYRLDPASLDLAPGKVSHFRFTGALIVGAMVAVGASVVLALRDRGHLAQGFYLAVVAVESVGILGVYGYIVTTAANPFLRQLAAAQWLILMTALILVSAIDVAIYRGARSYGGIRWGEVPARSQYALVSLCVIIIMTMGMMAYVRSGLRENWHIYGVMEDTSRWAYTPGIGVMAEMVGGITIVFLLAISFLFWLASLTAEGSDEQSVG